MLNADVYFKTEYKIGNEQKLVLSGDSPELGCWQDEYAIEAMPLEPWDDGVHVVTIKLPMNKIMRWKWAIADEDSKIIEWEEHPDRKLRVDRKLILIYAPWNKEEKIMDESVQVYDFVPSSVLFDISWQKAIPKRRMYQPDNNRRNKSSSGERERNDTLSKDKQETREKMIELQRKWSESDRSQSMEDFLQKGYDEFVKQKGRQLPAGASPKHVTFQENINIVGETSISPLSAGPACGNVSPKQRLERPKSARIVLQETCTSPEPGLRPEVQTRVCEYLEHIEGERKRRKTLSAEEKEREDKEVEEEEEVSAADDHGPSKTSTSLKDCLMLVTGAAGCVLLLYLGYYVYKKQRI